MSSFLNFNNTKNIFLSLFFRFNELYLFLFEKQDFNGLLKIINIQMSLFRNYSSLNKLDYVFEKKDFSYIFYMFYKRKSFVWCDEFIVRLLSINNT